MSDVRLKVSFSEGDKIKEVCDDFSDEAEYALGDNPLDVSPEDILSKICDTYMYSPDLLNLERYVVKRQGRVIRVQPKNWKA